MTYIEIKSVVVVRQTHGQDRINIEFVGPTPYPELDEIEPGKYPPYAEISCRRGYAEQWIEKADLGIENFTLIDAQSGKKDVIPVGSYRHLCS